MSDKQEASEDKVVVTDDMLSSAADAVDNAEEVVEETTEEVVEETTEEETTEEVVEETTEETAEETTEETTEEEVVEEEEPVSAADRSRLGRKVKNQDTTIQTLLKRIEDLEGKGTTAEPDPDDLEADDFVKASDVPKLIKAEKLKEQNARTAYDSSFLSKVLEIGTNEGMDDALQDEIFEEMQKNFNSFDRVNPDVDAEITFRKAHVAVIQRQNGAKPKNPLKGGKSKVATGVGGATGTKVVAAKPVVKLDAHAAAFIADTGGSVEKASEVLAGTGKAHLSFNRG